VEVVSSGGATLSKPLDGAGGANSACATYEPRNNSTTENPRSMGVRMRYGQFRFLDLGDLVWNKLGELVCPINMIGESDVYLVAHHANGDSNVPAVLAAVRPRVAIVNNGPYKGGAASALATLRGTPAIEHVWQLHRSFNDGAENVPDAFIANLDVDAKDKAEWIKLSARDDGSFTVTNGRTGWTHVYDRR
jgi:competence protein ComEC